MSAATLNGTRVTHARASIPVWGCWYAEAQLDGEVTIAAGSRATLVMADLTLVGTVLSGGPALGRSHYRIIAGNGGWGRTIRRWSYADDAGVRLSKILGDAAREAGETMVIDTTARVGPSWTRDEGPASDALNVLAPSSWYVDEAGTTRLGARPAGVLPAKVTRVTPLDKGRGRVVLASDSIATILPSVVVDGMPAMDVVHELTPEGGLRSTVWGAANAGATEALRELLESLDPDRKFRAPTEYVVDTFTGSRVNLTPARKSSGMPELKLVPVRPGVAGCEATMALGSRVLVGFIDADPSRPFIFTGEDADGERFLPTRLDLVGGGAAVARVGDTIQISISQFGAAGASNGGGPVAITSALSGTITSGSPKVNSG